MKDLVSVVLPVYNLENQMSRCIESLLQQTYPFIEIIFVDDGSKDGSLRELQSLQAQYPDKIRVIHQENQGAGEARNNGIRHAKGEFICFIDADDWVEVTYVEKMIAALKEHDADYVVCDYMIEPYDQSESELIQLKLQSDVVYTLKDNPEVMNKIGNAPWNKTFRRDIILSEKIEFPKFYRHHDLVFSQRYLLRCNRLVYVSEPLNHYLKDRPNNISTSYDKKIDHILKMLELVVEDYQNQRLFDACYKELKYLVVSNLVVSLRKIRFFTDTKFVFSFINESFSWLKSVFPDYKKSEFFKQGSNSDRIYSSECKCKLYYLYVLLRRKLSKEKV